MQEDQGTQTSHHLIAEEHACFNLQFFFFFLFKPFFFFHSSPHECHCTSSSSRNERARAFCVQESNQDISYQSTYQTSGPCKEIIPRVGIPEETSKFRKTKKICNSDLFNQPRLRNVEPDPSSKETKLVLLNLGLQNAGKLVCSCHEPKRYC